MEFAEADGKFKVQGKISKHVCSYPVGQDHLCLGLGGAQGKEKLRRTSTGKLPEHGHSVTTVSSVPPSFALLVH